jgi:hypothetical protein
VDYITLPTDEFCRVTGLGKTTVGHLIKDNILKTVAIGNRRLIVVESYRKLIADKQNAPPVDCRRNGDVPTVGRRRGSRVVDGRVIPPAV